MGYSMNDFALLDFARREGKLPTQADIERENSRWVVQSEAVKNVKEVFLRWHKTQPTLQDYFDAERKRNA
jgi:hypothetical protein